MTAGLERFLRRRSAVFDEQAEFTAEQRAFVRARVLAACDHQPMTVVFDSAARCYRYHCARCGGHAVLADLACTVRDPAKLVWH